MHAGRLHHDAEGDDSVGLSRDSLDMLTEVRLTEIQLILGLV